MSGPKVVPFDREGWRDALAALKGVVADIESGELAPVNAGVLVLMDRDGGTETFAFGPRADDITALGLLRIGEQVIIDSRMDGE
ncbi:hypothetical protein QAO71_10510 [Halopseudomonas sp. SMJS2]|uniref:hypothetical protein n=1 Tax=Halopseudomonas sp. SMJS2 TaxID=3041098 RepID=UPI0024536E4F|nr:hypothetical protein [Halopseudomonas sp. SMJS2]WGK60525.1 hypothetical protein QAO71_10510 [Halopseudomonas sp. SMJS2]